MIRSAVLDFGGCRCQTCFIGYHLLRKSGEDSMVMSLSSHRVKEHYNWETNITPFKVFINTFSLPFLKESLPNVASRLFDRRSSVFMET